MEFLQQTNPLLFVLLFVIIYLSLYAFRQNIKSFLLLFATIFLLSLLFLPGGKAISEKTGYLKSPEERALCLGKSLIHGGLWDTRASNKYCKPSS